MSKATGKLALSLGCFAIVIGTISGCGNGNQSQTNAGKTSNSNGNSNGQPRTQAATTLNETGSSLLFPLFDTRWIPSYHKIAPNIRINAASTGSGTGITEALSGTVQIGASDAYLSSAQMVQTPHVLNIPLAVSAQQIMYHLPGVPDSVHLKLTGDVLAKMYQGKIVYWDDTAIKSLNPSVKLAHRRIVLVTRSDGSGDTFLFTQFLTNTSTEWANLGLTGTSVSWPAVPGSVGAKGNSGVVDTLASTPYSIGYVGISWLDAGVAKGLGYASLRNRTGNFVLPTPATIQSAAVAGAKSAKTDARVSLIYEAGKTAYPIVNFEYAIVNQTQQASLVKPLKQFLTWAISSSGGNQPKYLKPVHFLPLPPAISALSKKQINKIGQ